jgi:hypothetical protein
MYLIWKHGPLTVAEVHRMSADLSPTTVATFLKRLVAKGYLTTALEPSSPAGGRPPERFYPRLDYSAGFELVVREFLADYLFGDPAGLSFLAQTVQQSLSAADEVLPARASGKGRQLPNKSS